MTLRLNNFRIRNYYINIWSIHWQTATSMMSSIKWSLRQWWNHSLKFNWIFLYIQTSDLVYFWCSQLSLSLGTTVTLTRIKYSTKSAQRLRFTSGTWSHRNGGAASDLSLHFFSQAVVEFVGWCLILVCICVSAKKGLLAALKILKKLMKKYKYWAWKLILLDAWNIGYIVLKLHEQILLPRCCCKIENLQKYDRWLETTFESWKLNL